MKSERTGEGREPIRLDAVMVEDHREHPHGLSDRLLTQAGRGTVGADPGDPLRLELPGAGWVADAGMPRSASPRDVTPKPLIAAHYAKAERVPAHRPVPMRFAFGDRG